ncbi:MAG: K(+)-stimulated pyrophosphate-energized sodium pump [Chloroflexi bacterium]|jgi:K(+)-stimulated pyrophosphate-energized sodium pump|nr:MAG: K(+)-stimulated pyrophosphate-energized sodium pump [Chloroflexota bacterium]
MTWIIIAIALGIVSLAFAGFKTLRVLREDQGDDTIKSITLAIKEGSNAFLYREYQYLIAFVAIIYVIVTFLIDWETGLAYLVGAIASGVAGWAGMNVAVRANGRTTAAAIRGLNPALRVAFSGGTVMGHTVVGLGLVALTATYLIFQDITIVTGLGFGASSIALFARVGGGIFTKAADVGADLVGKVEQGIPEDDPRNPATIADNVGDNVGDVAGMGADLFESYVGSIIAAITIAAGTAIGIGYDSPYAVLPLAIAAAGIFAGIIGTFFVSASENAGFSTLLWALRRGVFVAGALVIALSLGIVLYMDVSFNVFWIIMTGLVSGILIGLATEYYTSYEYKPTRNVAEQSLSGPATTIISGFATGMQSTVIPVIVVGTAIIISFKLAEAILPGLGFYGVALAAVGMLSTLGITLSTDAYGPIADNAGGIAEQAHLDPSIRQRTDALDSLGNTTAATGKGFAIGSAALTALALMAAYANAVGLNDGIDILNFRTLAGALVGGMLPFIFSALTMNAVGRAAHEIVNEVRRQFREIPGIMDGTGRPDYARCVDMSTKSALREMVIPGLIAVLVPLAVGFVLGPEALGGLLVGAIISGFMMALTMSTAGGAWDNAKKWVEAGNLGGKGSDAHKAAVVGDTVGDPFKDTSGPSLNILLKLMAIVALVFAPVFLEVTPLIGG